MFHIAICDDEEHFLSYEKKLIAGYMGDAGYQYEIDTFSSGVEFLAMGEKVSEYDIIFLDINMDDLDGIETARQIRTYAKDNTYIVFVTAFISYALEGYKVDAVRYLLKDGETLEKAMKECLDTIAGKMCYAENKITFSFQEGENTVSVDDILYIESNLHKLQFHIIGQASGSYTMYERLDQIQELLKDFPFCRIHKSYLVNMNHMEMIGRYTAYLSNGEKISISQPKYNSVREQFMDYKGEI